MNSVEAGATWKSDLLNFHGLSLSGIRTSLSIPELKIAFDVAQGFPFLFSMKKFFITHGHLDHAAGIPYLISQKLLLNMAAAEFYMPPSLVEPLEEIMRLWQKIEDHTYDCHFVAVKPDQEISLNPMYFIKAFPTYHRIESFGYTLFSRTKKLRAEFAEATEDEIRLAKSQGKKVDEWLSTPLVSFTGDTTADFLKGPDWIRQSKYLFLETTYLDDKKSIAHARRWGHTHLDEIIPQLDLIESEKIVLIHISSRYSLAEAQRIVSQKIPTSHRDRVLIFPGR